MKQEARLTTGRSFIHHKNFIALMGWLLGDGMNAPKQRCSRIVIVEDEEALGLILSYNLEAEGFVVVCVEGGDAAEVRLAEWKPDLVILDVMLPGLSGLEIWRRMRARESTRSLPVLMLTGRREESERVRGLAMGADDYVVRALFGSRAHGSG